MRVNLPEVLKSFFSFCSVIQFYHLFASSYFNTLRSSQECLLLSYKTDSSDFTLEWQDHLYLHVRRDVQATSLTRQWGGLAYAAFVDMTLSVHFDKANNVNLPSSPPPPHTVCFIICTVSFNILCECYIRKSYKTSIYATQYINCIIYLCALLVCNLHHMQRLYDITILP